METIGSIPFSSPQAPSSRMVGFEVPSAKLFCSFGKHPIRTSVGDHLLGL